MTLSTENLAVLREVNDRIAKVGWDLGADTLDFLCECSDPGCVDGVALTLAEYAAIRGHRPILSMGHSA